MRRLSKKSSRNCPKAVIDSAVLFAGLTDKKSLEAVVLEWSKNDEIALSISEQSVEEIERVLDIGSAQVRAFLETQGIDILASSSVLSDVRYPEYASESRSAAEPCDRLTFISAKAYLKKNPSAMFVTNDKELLKLNSALFERARTVKQFMDGL